MNTPSSVSFNDLVLMLATMAAVHLGEVGDPVTGETQRNLPAAGQMIDLLSVIQQNTVDFPQCFRCKNEVSWKGANDSFECFGREG